MKRAVLCFRYRRYYSSSTLTRVVLNETQMELAIIFTPVPCSTLTRVVLNETAPHRIQVAMIFDLQAGNSLACAFWCIEFVSFHIVSCACKHLIPQLHFC